MCVNPRAGAGVVVDATEVGVPDDEGVWCSDCDRGALIRAVILAPWGDSDEALVVQGIAEPPSQDLQPISATVGEINSIDLDDLGIGDHRAVGDPVPKVVGAGVVVKLVVTDGSHRLERHAGKEPSEWCGFIGQRPSEGRGGRVLLNKTTVDELETIAQTDLENAPLERLAQIGNHRIGRRNV